MTLDDTGAPISSLVKDAWGVGVSGTTTERYSAIAQRETDSESGLVYMRNRMYDPNGGRFTQTDPIRGNRPVKQYAYAANNPVSRTDPLGLDDTPEGRARILKIFTEWYGDKGLILLNGFINSGGSVDFEDSWFTGSRTISLDPTHEGSAAQNLLGALVKSIGVFTPQEKLNVAAAFGIEDCSLLNLATATTIANAAGKVIDSSRLILSMVSPQFAIASGVNRLLQKDYLGAVGDLAAPITKGILKGTKAIARGIEGEATFAGKLAAEGSAGEKLAAEGAAVRFGPHMEGPLPIDVAKSFRGGSYTQLTLDTDITLYRVYGGKSKDLGSYWTRVAPNGPLQARMDLALKAEWGNTAENVVQINVPKGTVIYEGAAAPQGALLGGGSQVYIPKVDPSWVTGR
jgi:RHS repeat-associated protein